MKMRGVLVRPLADQGDRNGALVDPAGVAFIEGRDYPLCIEFDYERAVGYGVVTREEDGSLTAAGEIVYLDPQAAKGLRLAAGVAFDPADVLAGVVGHSGRRVVARSRLNAIGLTANHADPGQPAIEEIP
jgi:hypothetical protein